MQEEFVALVAEHRDRGGTVFLSSHDLDEVQRACDRVAIIRDGRLAAVEHVADLRGRSYHQVVIQFAAAVEPREFARIPEVTGIQADGRRPSFDPLRHARGRRPAEGPGGPAGRRQPAVIASSPPSSQIASSSSSTTAP